MRTLAQAMAKRTRKLSARLVMPNLDARTRYERDGYSEAQAYARAFNDANHLCHTAFEMTRTGVSMNRHLLQSYKAHRAAGWHAAQALRAAHTSVEWDDAGGYIGHDDDGNPQPGDVRLRIVEDECPDLSYLEQRGAERQVAAVYERANRDGCTGIVGEYFDGDEWVHADSVYGFIGDDWRDSGYDVDVKRTTLDAAREYVNAQLLQGTV